MNVGELKQQQSDVFGTCECALVAECDAYQRQQIPAHHFQIRDDMKKIGLKSTESDDDVAMRATMML